MSIADILIILTTWIFQKIILPILPVNLPFLPFSTFQGILWGSVKHNLIWGLAGVNQFLNLNLLFILVAIVIFGEILFWTVKAGLFFIKLIRG